MWRDRKTGAEQVVLKLRRIEGQTARGTQRTVPTVPADEDAPTSAVVALASEYGRYGTLVSPRCCRRRGGRWAKTGSSASGIARG